MNWNDSYDLSLYNELNDGYDNLLKVVNEILNSGNSRLVKISKLYLYSIAKKNLKLIVKLPNSIKLLSSFKRIYTMLQNSLNDNSDNETKILSMRIIVHLSRFSEIINDDELLKVVELFINCSNKSYINEALIALKKILNNRKIN